MHIQPKTPRSPRRPGSAPRCLRVRVIDALTHQELEATIEPTPGVEDVAVFSSGSGHYLIECPPGQTVQLTVSAPGFETVTLETEPQRFRYHLALMPNCSMWH